MNSSEQKRYRDHKQTAQMSNRMSSNIHLSEVPEIELPDENFPEKPSYLKYTFINPYNLTLFGGALAAAALTFNPLIAVAALGLEGLWLLHGSQSGFMQKWLWDPMFENEKAEFIKKQRMKMVDSMGPQGKQRVMALMEKEQQIKSLAAQNPSFTGDLLRSELAKTNNLVNAYIDLAINCSRYENYLRTINLVDLQAQRNQYMRYLETHKTNNINDAETQLLKKNLAVIEKRIERVDEINRYLKIAYGQIALIENSFQLIADQIVTMQSSNELSGQLDGLLDGIESIKATTNETDEVLKSL
jgi:hypothetical protein